MLETFSFAVRSRQYNSVVMPCCIIVGLSFGYHLKFDVAFKFPGVSITVS